MVCGHAHSPFPMFDPSRHETALSRRHFLGSAALGVMTLGKFSARRPVEEDTMPELNGATGWINSAPLTRQGLRGKVVLADIWTYSCINSIRQLPYLKAWAAKYKSAGLVVLGVHSPEFGFEKERANVERAVRELAVSYPNAIDSNQAIWRGFNNEYWPADYVIDGKGQIRHHHFGEGDYEETERVIQDLLRENGATTPDRSMARVQGVGIEAAPDFADARSPETYVGYNRAEHFASPERVAPSSQRTYSLPPGFALNEWALSGAWIVDGESAALRTAPGTIAYRFHSRDLHFVLAPAANGADVRFTVRVDGVPPGDDHGVDTMADGSGVIREPRLYQLLRQQGRVTDRTFEIEFLDPGIRAFSFTFG
jgi:thiol-disulfide isomerase/thioredoxin